MIANEKTFESALKELDSFSRDKEVADLRMDDPLAAAEINAPVLSGSVSKLSKGTILNGDINSTDPISVEGRVNGNIDTESDVGVSGTMFGNIAARNINYQSAGVRGNAVAKQTAVLDKNSVVVGDITSDNITIGGKIKGSVLASDKLLVEGSALIAGTITTHNISISDGAKISASINITNDEAVDDSNFEF